MLLMKTTPEGVRREVDGFLRFLADQEIALLVNPVTVAGSTVSWASAPGNARFLEERSTTTLRSYKHWIDTRSYSAVLMDGALLQITYEIVDRAITGHRLAFIPSPFNMDSALMQSEGLTDLVDLYETGQPQDVILRSSVRFDFDPSASDDVHPSSHLTINGKDCRIPCAAPLRLGHFADFIFRNFYRDVWNSYTYLRELSKERWGDHTITSVESSGIHLNWPAFSAGA